MKHSSKKDVAKGRSNLVEVGLHWGITNSNANRELGNKHELLKHWEKNKEQCGPMGLWNLEDHLPVSSGRLLPVRIQT